MSSHIFGPFQPARCSHVTNDKFRELCEQVLLPRLGDFTFQQFTELYRALYSITGELLRISNRVDWIAARLNERDKHEGH